MDVTCVKCGMEHQAPALPPGWRVKHLRSPCCEAEVKRRRRATPQRAWFKVTLTACRSCGIPRHPDDLVLLPGGIYIGWPGTVIGRRGEMAACCRVHIVSRGRRWNPLGPLAAQVGKPMEDCHGNESDEAVAGPQGHQGVQRRTDREAGAGAAAGAVAGA